MWLQANFKLPPVWFVAENFRFEEAFVEAARIMPRLGFLLKLDLVADTPLNARYTLTLYTRLHILANYWKLEPDLFRLLDAFFRCFFVAFHRSPFNISNSSA